MLEGYFVAIVFLMVSDDYNINLFMEEANLNKVLHDDGINSLNIKYSSVKF